MQAEGIYTEQIAKIERASLGWEDHGIFTLMLHLDYGGGGQGAGGYSLDEPRQDGEGHHIGRFGTAFGMEFIIRVMRACGAQDWSQVEGKTIIALREDDGFHAKVAGIKPLPFEKGEPFIFGELVAEFFHE